MLFTTGSYTGDGNDDRNITGVGFQPDQHHDDAPAIREGGFGHHRHAGLRCDIGRRVGIRRGGDGRAGLWGSSERYTGLRGNANRPRMLEIHPLRGH